MAIQGLESTRSPGRLSLPEDARTFYLRLVQRLQDAAFTGLSDSAASAELNRKQFPGLVPLVALHAHLLVTGLRSTIAAAARTGNLNADRLDRLVTEAAVAEVNVKDPLFQGWVLALVPDVLTREQAQAIVGLGDNRRSQADLDGLRMEVTPGRIEQAREIALRLLT